MPPPPQKEHTVLFHLYHIQKQETNLNKQSGSHPAERGRGGFGGGSPGPPRVCSYMKTNHTVLLIPMDFLYTLSVPICGMGTHSTLDPR